MIDLAIHIHEGMLYTGYFSNGIPDAAVALPLTAYPIACHAATFIISPGVLRTTLSLSWPTSPSVTFIAGYIPPGFTIFT